MALSSQVSEHLNDALSSVRSALWHASKNERPSTITQIAKLLADIDSINAHDEVLDSIDNMLQDIRDKEKEDDWVKHTV